MKKNGIKVEIGWPSRAGEPISLRVGGETVPLASYEADKISQDLGEAAAVTRELDRESFSGDARLAAVAAGLKVEAPKPSRGINGPCWKAVSDQLRLEWRDNQGRRCYRFAGTFHDQAGKEDWARKTLAVLVLILNEANSAAVVLASECEAGKQEG